MLFRQNIEKCSSFSNCICGCRARADFLETSTLYYIHKTYRIKSKVVLNLDNPYQSFGTVTFQQTDLNHLDKDPPC